MLKALELTGFKSFAEKTRFEFPAGITVVVGPNGSGKSNIVDAVKWVLGTSSAKSLRGKEMTDVIFKCPTGSTRREVNVAEATIIFDNTNDILPLDSAEVRVTRRVYRSGEGEYLINDEPCRLKDIKTLIRGTGIGADAYSIIEQGKVARMLEASAKDRRQIFEEAAGISRFKAKKIEALRRLGRVDQNLTRLSDIVEEVEGRLKAVRNQATKARRYKEFTDRLQQLRTQIGMVQWRQLSKQLKSFDEDIERFSAELSEYHQQQDQGNQSLQLLESENESLTQQAQRHEELASDNREQIAQHVTTNEQQTQRLNETMARIARLRIQLATAAHGADGVEGRMADTQQTLQASEAQHKSTLRSLGTLDNDSTDIKQQLSDARRQTEVSRQHQSDIAQHIAQAQSAYQTLESKSSQLREQFDNIEQTIADTATSAATIQNDLLNLQNIEEALGHRIHDLEAEEETLRRESLQQKQLLTRRQQNLTQLNERLTAKRERESILAELEQQREGVNGAVSQLLREADEGAHKDLGIIGLVADLVQSEYDTARLIDIALGDRAQLVVTSNDQLLSQISNGTILLKTRLGVINFQTLAATETQIDISDTPGVIGRLDQAVQIDSAYSNLLSVLLSNTWIVDDLTTAHSLAKRYLGRLRLITPHAELVDCNGAVCVGPPDNCTGLVSRRMELSGLQQDIYVLTAQIKDHRAELTRIENNQSTLTAKLDDTVAQLNSERHSILKHHITTEGYQAQLTHLADEGFELDGQRHSLQAQLQANKTSLTRQNTALVDLQTTHNQHIVTVQESQQTAQILDKEHQTILNKITDLRITLGKTEQQCTALQTQLDQFAFDHEERKSICHEQTDLLRETTTNAMQSRMHILSGTSALAELYLTKDQHRTFNQELRQQVAECEQQRRQIANALASTQSAMESITKEKHDRELNSRELRLERRALQDRLREDYGIEIANLHVENETDAEIEQREQVEEEIATLRSKINNIGAVNMEALGELNDLESRFDVLSAQFNDLTKAKETLERIIQRINADSRRLFLETLEQIRINFQALYRQTFGGGQADIVLEEGVDVLEAGVEIITSPPGKPLINISLLSGGEKALTAVSLLLAIFQFRPSPFCILDEVDAPFDEANIGRFINVLKGFLDWSRFVIVTHSKKTMTAADTLYGVTMQESGVSKQVSVRFEDVAADGSISLDDTHVSKAA
ncbi:MAG: chromosome segregation protein SMC [Planctomycetaceae bacterium]|nr:chromosome segregation protein SMC [Planctomycetaceae bacterium]